MAEFQLPATFKGGPPVSAAVKALNMESASAGIEASFGVIKMKGKVWSLQYRGKNYPFMRPDGDGPRGFLNVVFLKMAETKSKTYYKKWKDGQAERPICWSNDAVRPDPAVPAENRTFNDNGTMRVSEVCALCPMNRVGSAHSDDGKAMRACRDHKRAAVYIDPEIVKTIMNEQVSEPVMLRIPAASLNDFASFGENMKAQGFPMISFVTQIGFDPKFAFQKLTFTPLARLTDQECDAAIGMRNDPLADRIINSAPVSEEPGGEPSQHGGPTTSSPPEAVAAAMAVVQSNPSPGPGPVPIPQTPPTLQAEVIAPRASMTIIDVTPTKVETLPTKPAAPPTPPVDNSDFSVTPEADAMLAELLK